MPASAGGLHLLASHLRQHVPLPLLPRPFDEVEHVLSIVVPLVVFVPSVVEVAQPLLGILHLSVQLLLALLLLSRSLFLPSSRLMVCLLVLVGEEEFVVALLIAKYRIIYILLNSNECDIS